MNPAIRFLSRTMLFFSRYTSSPVALTALGGEDDNNQSLLLQVSQVSDTKNSFARMFYYYR